MLLKKEKKSEAEICQDIVVYTVNHEDLLTRFVQESGISPDELKKTLHSQETIAAILDFLLSEEEHFLDFCHTNTLSPERIWEIRKKFPGFSPV